jgi:hypothetical protein
MVSLIHYRFSNHPGLTFVILGSPPPFNSYNTEGIFYEEDG